MLETLTIARRTPLLGGQLFGEAGAYETIAGRATFALDSTLPGNAAVVDLDRAPRDADGRVRCSADIWLLRPIDGARASGTLLYDVINRGNKTVFSNFCSALPNNNPHEAQDFGNGFLLRRGTTIAALGWQTDIRPGLARMTIDAPAPLENGRPITGPLRLTLIPDRPARSLEMTRPDHLHHPPLDLADPEARLDVRDAPFAEARLIPRERWAFAMEDANGRRPSPDHLWLADGFEAGLYYEVVYAAAAPAIAGVGLAVTRDFVSFLRHEPADAQGTSNPLNESGRPAVARTIGFGSSQSGRFLRQFVQEGFNADEQGRRVFDGLLVYIAAASMGSFNHRFAQPGKTRPHVNGVYSVERFPFADESLDDPISGHHAGLLDSARAEGVVPRIFAINSSAEYWGGAASLLHTDPLGEHDTQPADTSRVYHIAGTQHVAGTWPVGEAGQMALLPYPTGKHPLSPVMVQPIMRALFAAMEGWLREGTEPPPSAYPRLADGTLSTFETVRESFPAIPGVHMPSEIALPRLLDYGPRWVEGIIDQEPPGFGAAYGARVPAVNADGNEPAGVQPLELRVPLATYTGWNPRHPDTGNPSLPAAMLGSYLPFVATDAEAAVKGDPRPSIAARYRDRDEFLQRVDAAIADLLAERLLLEEDVPALRRRAEAQWAAHAPTPDAVG